MTRPLPELEHFLSVANVAGTEVLFTVRVPSSDEVVSINMNAVFREIYDAFRALEKFVEAKDITARGGLGGLGAPPQA